MKKIIMGLMLVVTLPSFAMPVPVKCILDENIDTDTKAAERISYSKVGKDEYMVRVAGRVHYCDSFKVKAVMNMLCQNEGEPDRGLYLSVKSKRMISINYETFEVMATYSCR